MPDPLINNKLYSIQTSNLNTWTTEGFNDLLQTYSVPSLRITNNRIDDEIIQVKIYDLYGQLVSEDLELSNLKEGIYIVVGQTRHNITVTKKIKI